MREALSFFCFLRLWLVSCLPSGISQLSFSTSSFPAVYKLPLNHPSFKGPLLSSHAFHQWHHWQWSFFTQMSTGARCTDALPVHLAASDRASPSTAPLELLLAGSPVTSMWQVQGRLGYTTSAPPLGSIPKLSAPSFWKIYNFPKNKWSRLPATSLAAATSSFFNHLYSPSRALLMGSVQCLVPSHFAHSKWSAFISMNFKIAYKLMTPKFVSPGQISLAPTPGVRG